MTNFPMCTLQTRWRSSMLQQVAKPSVDCKRLGAFVYKELGLCWPAVLLELSLAAARLAWYHIPRCPAYASLFTATKPRLRCIDLPRRPLSASPDTWSRCGTGQNCR